jgi:arylsulfatase A-like enzyme
MAAPTMEWSRRKFLASAGATAAGAGAVVGLRHLRQSPKNNIVVIIADQLRAQALSAYGGTNIATPAWDNVLSEGARFEWSFAQNPVCAPARAGLLTGLYPKANGITKNTGNLKNGLPSLGHLARQAGMKTGWIGKWHLGEPVGDNRFIRKDSRSGFLDYWAANYSQHRYSRFSYHLDANKRLFAEQLDAFEPDFQATLAIEKMREWRDERFCLAVSFGPPHPPLHYETGGWERHIPQRFRDMVNRADLTYRPNVPKWAASIEDQVTDPGTGKPIHSAGWYLHQYYASILSLEDPVARIIRSLDELGIADNTLLVVTSDHGEQGGSHGRFHKKAAYEESTRVPLGMRWPGVIAPRVLNTPTTLVDVLPTVLSLSGISIPSGLHGRDLAPQVLGSEPDLTDSVVLGSYTWSAKQRWYSLRGHRWAFTQSRVKELNWLYDMVEDPHQLNDLLHDPSAASTVERLTATLRKRVRAVGEEL